MSRSRDAHAERDPRAPRLPFVALWLVLFSVSFPSGANRDWLWPLFAAALFAIAAMLAVGVALGRWRLGEGFALSRIWIAILLAWLATAALALLPIPAVAALDATAAQKAVLLQAAIVCLALLVLALVDTPRRAIVLVLAVFLAGVAQAAYGSFMTLSGIEWGWLAPKSAGRGWASGTFVNRNHFAAYLAMAASVGVGLLVAQLSDATHETWRARLRAVTALLLGPKTWIRLPLVAIVIGLVLSQSRMGNVAFFTALSIVGAWALVAMRPLPRSLVVLLVSVVVVDLLLVGSRFGVERVAERLGATTVSSTPAAGQYSDVERIEVARDTLVLWRAHPWLGVGPGGFRTAYPAVKSAGVSVFYDHAHNDWAQVLAERGAVGLALWAGLLGVPLFCALRAMRRRRDTRLRGLAFGSAMAATALAIHGFADFNWQIPANALTLVALLAVGVLADRLPGLKARRTASSRHRSTEAIRPTAGDAKILSIQELS